jgi:hypothetical protein
MTTVFKIATILANYVGAGDKDALFNYMAQNDIDEENIHAYLAILNNEHRNIIDIQNEYNDKRGVSLTDTILSESFVNDVLKTTTKEVTKRPKETLDSLTTSSIVAYKFQIRFSIIALRQILTWTKTRTLH